MVTGQEGKKIADVKVTIYSELLRPFNLRPSEFPDRLGGYAIVIIVIV